jgi:hypothetical protein
MHLRVRPLQVLIELFLLVVAQDLADLFVGLVALGPCSSWSVPPGPVAVCCAATVSAKNEYDRDGKQANSIHRDSPFPVLS